MASYSTAALAPGLTHTLTAIYSGDTNFTGSSTTASASSTVTVAPLDFTMTLTGPSNLTVVPGQSISYQVTVTPDYGSYAGTVNFAVNGLPPGATVSFSPASIAANGGPQTITVTIHTAPATAMLHREPKPSGAGRAAPFALAFLLLFGAGSIAQARTRAATLPLRDCAAGGRRRGLAYPQRLRLNYRLLRSGPRELHRHGDGHRGQLTAHCYRNHQRAVNTRETSDAAND